MTPLEYMAQRFEIDVSANQRMPIEIFDTDRQDLASLFRELGYTEGVEVGTKVGRYAKMLCLANRFLHLTCVDPYQPYNADIVRMPSLDAVHDFEDGSLDFVYLDGDHEFSSVTADLTAWLPKLRPGGIMSGHDYVRRNAASLRRGYIVQVVEALAGFTEAWYIRPWFVLGGKAIDPYYRRDRPRSWMWVKA